MSAYKVEGMKATLGMEFTLEWRDKDGNIVGTMDAKGTWPVGEMALLQPEFPSKGTQDGSDNR